MIKDRASLHIAVGITGSYDQISHVLKVIKRLKQLGHTITLFVTPSVFSIKELKSSIETYLDETFAESLSTYLDYKDDKAFDMMLVAPLTGNSMSKLANGVTDNAVLKVANKTLLNDKPVILGISTNDALGLNGVNLMKLMVSKNVFFVPFGQDDPEHKPYSLVAEFSKIEDTINESLNGKQIQPIIVATKNA